MTVDEIIETDYFKAESDWTGQRLCNDRQHRKYFCKKSAQS